MHVTLHKMMDDGHTIQHTVLVAYQVWLNYNIIKTHGNVSCGPRKRGVRKRSEYIDRSNKVAIFTYL